LTKAAAAKAVTVPGKPDGLLALRCRLFSPTWGSPTGSDLDEMWFIGWHASGLAVNVANQSTKIYSKIFTVIFYEKFGQGLAPWRAGRRKAHVSGIAARMPTVKPVNT